MNYPDELYDEWDEYEEELEEDESEPFCFGDFMPWDEHCNFGCEWRDLCEMSSKGG